MTDPHASERLSYRKAEVRDTDDLLAWYTDEVAMRYVATEPFDPDAGRKHVDTVIRIGQRTDEVGFWVVHEAEHDAFVGLIKIVPFEPLARTTEVGYGLMPEWFGRGFATEMLRHTVGVLPRPQRDRWLVGVVHPANAASLRVLEKCGFAERPELLPPEPDKRFWLRAAH